MGDSTTGFLLRIASRRDPLWVTVAVAAVAAAALPCATSGLAAEPDATIVSCYDPARNLVTHTLAYACKGEVVSPAREAALDRERRSRIEANVTELESDRVTGKRRLVGAGSGFYIGYGGELLTNDHVTNHCEQLTASSDDGEKQSVVLVATSPQNDISLLRSTNRPHGVARFSPAPDLTDGMPLAIVGYPAYGLPVRFSILSQAEAAIDPMFPRSETSISFRGEVRHGDSGSPLLDRSGEVVGIVNATVDTPQLYRTTGKRITDIGIAIPAAAVLRFLAANGIKPLFGDARHVALPSGTLHEKARSFVVQIGCWAMPPARTAGSRSKASTTVP